MANIPAEELEEQLLYCAVCLDRYNQPRLLSCHHSFCSPCLERICAGGLNITCPTCRKQTPLNRKGVSALPVDRVVTRLLEIVGQYEVSTPPLAKTASCSICEKRTSACSRCLQCEQNLCSYHYQHHKMSHHIVQLNVELEQCSVHTGVQLTHYCSMCDHLICCRCQSDSAHDSHGPFSAISTLAGECQQNLQYELNRTAGALQDLNGTLVQLDQLTKSLIKRRDDVQHDISLHFDHLQGIVQRHGDSLVVQVQDACAYHLEQIDTMRQLLAAQRSEANDLHSDFLKLLAEGNWLRTLQHQSSLVARASQLFSQRSLATAAAHSLASDLDTVFIPGQLLSSTTLAASGRLIHLSVANSSFRFVSRSSSPSATFSCLPVFSCLCQRDAQWCGCLVGQSVVCELAIRDQNNDVVKPQNVPSNYAFSVSFVPSKYNAGITQTKGGISQAGVERFLSADCLQMNVTENGVFCELVTTEPGVYYVRAALCGRVVSTVAITAVSCIESLEELPVAFRLAAYLKKGTARLRLWAETTGVVRWVSPVLMTLLILAVLMFLLWTFLPATASFNGDGMLVSWPHGSMPLRIAGITPSLQKAKFNFEEFYGICGSPGCRSDTCSRMGFAVKSPALLRRFAICPRETDNADSHIAVSATASGSVLYRVAQFLMGNGELSDALRANRTQSRIVPNETRNPVGRLVNFILQSFPVTTEFSSEIGSLKT